jgi:hypothetical protein
MKIDFIADTNFLIYFHEGNVKVESFANYRFGISIISEIELLSFQRITSFEEIQLKSLLNNCLHIDLNNKIKEQTIQLKKQNQIKLPDAIIAATAIVNKVPLITADKGFSKVNGLNLILI